MSANGDSLLLLKYFVACKGWGVGQSSILSRTKSGGRLLRIGKFRRMEEMAFFSFSENEMREFYPFATRSPKR